MVVLPVNENIVCFYTYEEKEALIQRWISLPVASSPRFGSNAILDPLSLPRYVRFNIDALCSIAAQSVGSASRTDVTKLSEGNFNKALLLTMNDGKEVIAKITNPNAGSPQFITASEVAVMDFECPTYPSPEVFSWCSEGRQSPVGAEYIIMQKVPGEKLSCYWDDITTLDRSKIVDQLVQCDKSLVENPFPQYGSLYYHEDEAGSDRFMVGPTMNRKYFDDKRVLLNLDRGPWTLLKEYLVANATREKESILQLGDSPRLQGLFKGPRQYQPSRTAKLQAINSYTNIMRHLLPKNKADHRPVLWHPDLHGDNIFVDPKDPTQITGIIDWQAAHIAPLFLQARRPAILDVNGPLPQSLKLPTLPEDFHTLSSEEQVQDKKLHAEQMIYAYHEIELLRQSKDAGNALRGRETLLARISALVGSLFHDGEPIVLGLLMQVVDRWVEIVGSDDKGEPLVKCPISFTEEEKNSSERTAGYDGFVAHGEYDSMRQAVIDLRERLLAEVAETQDEREAWEKAWPFPVSV
ncbi:phosphotransferase enzyme family protein [Aspergillus californicus]